MNCKQYWTRMFGESSIHGFPYLVRRELHWLERVFWGGIIILAAYSSIDICLNQWQRFRDSPIVYAMELAWGKSNFPFVGITLCSESASEEDMERIIHDIWNVTETQNNTRYRYYMDFLNVLNSLNYMTLEKLEPYSRDSSLNGLKFVDTILDMRRKFLPNKEYAASVSKKKTKSDSTSKEVAEKEHIYAAAMTELGVCRTTSQLTRYTNPFGDFKSLKVSEIRFCDIMSDCNAKIFPGLGEDSGLLIFLHNVEDIMIPYQQGTIMRYATKDASMTIELLLNLITAETEVRNLPIAYRKCRYKDENNLEYFETYRPSLCGIECRINAAMQKCGCKPYFYIVAPHLPVCNIEGMLCLTHVQWPKVAQCNCPKLCEEETYVSTESTMQKDILSKFESTIIVKLFLPRMAMKRRVIFSTDQLIMSFGGAIGLFLGASFISIYGLLYVLCEYIFGNIWMCLRNKVYANKQRKRAEKRPSIMRETY